MGEVKEITVTTVSTSSKPHTIKKVKQPDLTTKYRLASSHFIDPVTGDDSLFFTREGIAPKTLRQLKQGKLRCQGQLDLHNLTIKEAETILAEFITRCIAAGLRQIRIIHGKGISSINPHPVLKNQVNNWLRNHPDVLAFASAQKKDGGTGALYVLLKQHR